MVTVIGYAQVERKDGTSFLALELSGGLELVQSTTTGKFYATTRRCRIPSTFEESIAQLMVGERIEGDIVRVVSEPYEYLNKRTGEMMTLTHSYAYRPKGAIELVGETPVANLELATS